MRVWLYGRLSNDDDVMMNSLENQLAIVREYARKQGYEIVGESYDDNVSGMRFDRKGLNQVRAVSLTSAKFVCFRIVFLLSAEIKKAHGLD